MRILSIELSAFTGSVALADDDHVVCESALPDDRQSAKSLIPAIKQTASQAGWSAESLDLICLTTGPGSFTSLRIAVTAAKVLAWSVNAEVLGVNTLRAIAHRAFTSKPEIKEIVAVMDAQRKQLFSAAYENAQGIPRENEATSIVDRQALFDQLPNKAVVTGVGIGKIAEQFTRMRPDIRVLDESIRQPQAVDVLRLALHDWRAGHREDLYRLVPQYYRQSAAEEKAAAQSD